MYWRIKFGKARALKVHYADKDRPRGLHVGLGESRPGGVKADCTEGGRGALRQKVDHTPLLQLGCQSVPQTPTNLNIIVARRTVRRCTRPFKPVYKSSV